MAHEQRGLAAILFADAVRSSWLMGRDESGTVVRLLNHLSERLAPALARRRLIRAQVRRKLTHGSLCLRPQAAVAAGIRRIL